jgi:hypothetical protein
MSDLTFSLEAVMAAFLFLLLLFLGGFGALVWMALESDEDGGKRSRERDLTSGFDYRLEEAEFEGGAGFVVRRCRDGQRLRWEGLPASDGIEAFPVAGTSYREDDINYGEFLPGRRLTLVPEPDNPHDANAVGVWDARQRIQAGYVS